MRSSRARERGWAGRPAAQLAGRERALVHLAATLDLDRGVLDAGLGELDDAGLIRVRGDLTTQRSSVQLTDAGLYTLDDTT